MQSDTSRAFNLALSVLTLLSFLGLLAFGLLDPAGFAAQLRKDALDGTGWIEHMTVIILVPGILLGCYTLARYRSRLPHPIVALWLLAWTLACLYFAGEEASWGQWYFKWGTPEHIAALNDQAETNLHNMSTWLDQKPRALVELFIFIAGLLIPLWRWINKGRRVLVKGFLAQWEGWLYAPQALILPALFFALTRVASWFPQTQKSFGNSELREFAVAYFLSFFLISFYVRLRQDGRR